MNYSRACAIDTPFMRPHPLYTPMHTQPHTHHLGEQVARVRAVAAGGGERRAILRQGGPRARARQERAGLFVEAWDGM